MKNKLNNIAAISVCLSMILLAVETICAFVFAFRIQFFHDMNVNLYTDIVCGLIIVVFLLLIASFILVILSKNSK